MDCPTNTPLVRKLGIKPGHRLALLNAPSGFLGLLGELPADVVVQTQVEPEVDAGLDVIVFFVRDLTEDVIRDIALEAGLVDNKVCAVDATWSGLRLVIRLKDRKRS